ncbi:MAG: putative DNA modification/repair radical SAM protein [Negativicutes bacterium]|nr:putative DNA modification/repair radical SAM protein [Negativicutes bacterium]
METLEKLKLLGEGAKYDICASTAAGGSKIKQPALGRTRPSGVCHSFTPDGRCISLFKVLLTNCCEKDCTYCPNRQERDVPRARFTSQELADLFMDFYRRNYVEGLFLSSGIWHSLDATMQEIIQVAEILRTKYRFGGYIHLKILPGARHSDIDVAARLADRISLNIEAPSAEYLARLSQRKNYNADIIAGLRYIQRAAAAHKRVSHSTQYIVGAAGETDKDILGSSTGLYRDFGLKRAYYSAFQPVGGTPLSHLGPAPLIRENRLYQSDFLLRLYGFTFAELPFDASGNLDQGLDPKMAFALANPQLYPVEINKASYQTLLRVPGIGPQSAQRIVRVRREFKLTDPRELKNAGVVLKRALSFLTLDGRFFGSRTLLTKPQYRQYQQLSLWGDQRDLMLADTGIHA